MKEKTKNILKKVGFYSSIAVISLAGAYFGTMLCLKRGVEIQVTLDKKI